MKGMLDLTHFATDGIKIKANASNRRVFTEEELEFVSHFVDDELEKWAIQDSLEDDFFNEVRGSDQLPKASKKRLSKKYIFRGILNSGIITAFRSTMICLMNMLRIIPILSLFRQFPHSNY